MKNMKKIIIAGLALCSLVYGQTGEEIAEKNGCFECHKMSSKNAAPAFLGTARRNLRLDSENAKEMMIKAIKKGSHGKYKNFTENQMPSFSKLSDEEINTLADWILGSYKEYRENKRK